MKLLFLILFLSSMSLADTFKISGDLMTFEKKDGLLIRGCETSCIALKKIGEFKKIDLKKIRAKETFRGSIGSDVCRLVYKGESTLGVTESKDQRAFCVFADQSMIETNSLSQYLSEKKIVIP